MDHNHNFHVGTDPFFNTFEHNSVHTTYRINHHDVKWPKNNHGPPSMMRIAIPVVVLSSLITAACVVLRCWCNARKRKARRRECQAAASPPTLDISADDVNPIASNPTAATPVRYIVMGYPPQQMQSSNAAYVMQPAQGGFPSQMVIPAQGNLPLQGGVPVQMAVPTQGGIPAQSNNHVQGVMTPQPGSQWNQFCPPPSYTAVMQETTAQSRDEVAKSTQ